MWPDTNLPPSVAFLKFVSSLSIVNIFTDGALHQQIGTQDELETANSPRLPGHDRRQLLLTLSPLYSWAHSSSPKLRTWLSLPHLKAELGFKSIPNSPTCVVGDNDTRKNTLLLEESIILHTCSKRLSPVLKRGSKALIREKTC